MVIQAREAPSAGVVAAFEPLLLRAVSELAKELVEDLAKQAKINPDALLVALVNSLQTIKLDFSKSFEVILTSVASAIIDQADARRNNALEIVRVAASKCSDVASLEKGVDALLKVLGGSPHSICRRPLISP